MIPVGACSEVMEMLFNASDLEGFSIHATDGTIGHVNHFYFDDENWSVRYLVVDTGTWLSGRRVLIPHFSIDHVDRGGRNVWVRLTCRQVENAPGIEFHRPVTRQHEALLIGYYGYPYYGQDPGVYAATPDGPNPQTDDSHLQSTKDVTDFRIEASDGGIGHVEDFIIDDESWTIRYMEVDTRNWWPGGKVLVAPRWIRQIDWKVAKVRVNLPREVIRSAPQYDPSVPLTRQYESSLFDHYEPYLDSEGRGRYWSEG